MSLFNGPENASQKSLSIHILIGIGLSTVLSISFYLLFGVFILGGFLIWSIVCGLAGGVVGRRLGSRLWGTLIVTAILRIGVFLLMTRLV